MSFSEEYVDKFLVRDLESEHDRVFTGLEIERILEFVDVRAPMLDLGVGHGVVIEALLEKFGECHVVEGSARLAARASSRYGSQVEVHRSYFEDFQPHQRFRTIFATAVLHHSKDPELLLQRIGSWLHPDGRMVLSVPNASSIHRVLAVGLGLQSSLSDISDTGVKSGVVRTFTPEEISDLVVRSGFTIVQRIPSFLKFDAYGRMSPVDSMLARRFFDAARLTSPDFHATTIFECKLRE